MDYTVRLYHRQSRCNLSIPVPVHIGAFFHGVVVAACVRVCTWEQYRVLDPARGLLNDGRCVQDSVGNLCGK